jgi:lipopolysaccharide export system permease protein
VKTLDKQRNWSFIKAFFICYVSLVGWYVVNDAFYRMYEFSERADGAVEMFQIMSRYYLVHQGLYLKPLCGALGMTAIFTVLESRRRRRGPAPELVPADGALRR